MRRSETGKHDWRPSLQSNCGPARRGQAGQSWYVDETTSGSKGNGGISIATWMQMAIWWIRGGSEKRDLEWGFAQRERSLVQVLPRNLRLPARIPSSIQIPLHRCALRQAQEPLERLWWAACLEKANGKHVAQHRRRQAAIFQISPRTEPTKKLREHILGRSCPLFRKEQGIRCPTFFCPQSIVLQIQGQRL